MLLNKEGHSTYLSRKPRLLWQTSGLLLHTLLLKINILFKKASFVFDLACLREQQSYLERLYKVIDSLYC